MAFNSGSPVKVLNVKVDLVKSQTQELQASLEAFIDKIQSDVIAVSTEKVAANHIAEINSRLDASLALLMGKWPQINDINEDNTVECVNLDTTRLPEQSVVQKELLTEISQLLQRVEKVETDVTLVLNRQQTKEAEIQAAQMQILKIEEDLKSVAIEKLNSEKEHNSQFESLDNRVKVLEEDDRLSALQKTLEDDSDVKEHETRLNTIEDLIQQLQIDCSEMDKIVQKYTEVQTLTKSVRDINHRQNKLESTSDSLSDRVETAMDRIAMSNENGKHEMGEFNKRLSIYAKKLDNLDSLFNQVCHMVSTKVNPLCRLQAILNKNHDTLKNKHTILQQMKTVNLKVDCLSHKVRKVELDTEKKTFIGFTAYFHNQMKIMKDSRLKFTDVRYNEGKCYYPASGTFTANRDGIYVAAVTLSQSSMGSVCVHVIQASPHGSGKVVCKAQTNDSCVNSCGIGVASLKAGDEMCVMVKDVSDGVCLSGFSSFSCILIADK